LHDDILATLILEAFDDLISRHLFHVRFRYLLILNRTEVAGSKLPETEFLLPGRGIDGDWNVNQSETNAPFPNWTHTLDEGLILYARKQGHVNGSGVGATEASGSA